MSNQDQHQQGGRRFAVRAARVLNDFIGHLHAARCSQAIWSRAHDDPRYRIAAKYGLQVAFGTIAMTMRKFEDFAANDLPELIPDEKQRPDDVKWLVRESKAHHLRAAANTLIAHYKDEARQIPSESEIARLIEKGGWNTEEELLAWVGPVIERLEAVRDAVMAYHHLKGLSE
jgi:hypothetical protein